jgi:mannose-6-phosphate isomerase
LSIQVHPSAQLARAGFEQEEAAGVPIDAPHRVYRDPHHKPEMVYALTTFDTLVGFRPTAEILRVLTAIESPLVQSIVASLHERPGFNGIVRVVERLHDAKPDVEDVDGVVESCRRLHERGIDIKRAYATAVEIAEHHPGDVGIVISLLLNRLTLQPGEAAFLGVGIIHAHLQGMCLELMASSDNVLRAGLTTKHLDPVGLVRCLDKGMSRLARVTPEQFGFSTDVFSPEVAEFALSVTQCSRAEPDGAALPVASRRIVVCTGGEVELVNEAGERKLLKRGDAIYADETDGALVGVGTGELAQAYTPTADTPAAELTDLV